MAYPAWRVWDSGVHGPERPSMIQVQEGIGLHLGSFRVSGLNLICGLILNGLGLGLYTLKGLDRHMNTNEVYILLIGWAWA